jgi:hypothetical protein
MVQFDGHDFNSFALMQAMSGSATLTFPKRQGRVFFSSRGVSLDDLCGIETGFRYAASICRS